MRPKASSSLLSFFLFVGLFIGLTGCGGGGDSVPVTDTNLAPVSLNTRTITLQDPDLASVSTSFTFTNSTYTSTGSDSGSYTYGRSSVTHQANLQLISSFTSALTYTLTFSSASGGTYVNTNTAKSSTFTLR